MVTKTLVRVPVPFDDYVACKGCYYDRSTGCARSPVKRAEDVGTDNNCVVGECPQRTFYIYEEVDIPDPVLTTRDRIRAYVESNGGDALDDLVRSASDREACQTNNNGLLAQLEYLNRRRKGNRMNIDNEAAELLQHAATLLSRLDSRSPTERDLEDAETTADQIRYVLAKRLRPAAAPTEPGHYWLILPRSYPEIVYVTGPDGSYRRKKGVRVVGNGWGGWLSDATPEWQWSQKIECPLKQPPREGQ